MNAKDSGTLSIAQGGRIAFRIAIENAIRSSMLPMRIKEARKQRLIQLQKKYGSLKKLANAIDPTKEYLDKYLSNIVAGHREMGDDLAARIEELERRPQGWMDSMGATSAEVSELLNIWNKFPEDEQRRILRELRFRLKSLQDDEAINGLAEAKKSPDRKPIDS